METGEFMLWDLLWLAVIVFFGIQTWWDFAEGRVHGPFGMLRRDANAIGFWLIQIGRVIFVTAMLTGAAIFLVQ